MRVWKIYYQVTCLLFLMALRLDGKEEQNSNDAVLQAVAAMPSAGGYATTPCAMKQLAHAVSLNDDAFIFHPASPSFCSEATYLAFLKTIALLQAQKKISLRRETLTALIPREEADGKGFWGCWNANGPGVARLFYTFHLGPNFTNLAAARPGDFLKIFWTDAIGAAEHGHLVIYLGSEKKGNVTYLRCWSSNKPDGYGIRSYALSRAHHLIFSRLTTPQALDEFAISSQRDPYLASLLVRESSWNEAQRLCGITATP